MACLSEGLACRDGVGIDGGVRVVLEQGDGEGGGDLTIGRLAHHGPVPPETPRRTFRAPRDLAMPMVTALLGMAAMAPAPVADGVGGLGLRGQGSTRVPRAANCSASAPAGLVEGQVAVDTDAAEGDVHAPQLLDEPVTLPGSAGSGNTRCSGGMSRSGSTLVYTPCGP